MLKIRLKKIGRKKLSNYRIVIVESKKRRNGKPVTDIGFYNPHTDLINIKKVELVKWIKNGAIPTKRIISLIRDVL